MATDKKRALTTITNKVLAKEANVSNQNREDRLADFLAKKVSVKRALEEAVEVAQPGVKPKVAAVATKFSNISGIGTSGSSAATTVGPKKLDGSEVCKICNSESFDVKVARATYAKKQVNELKHS